MTPHSVLIVGAMRSETLPVVRRLSQLRRVAPRLVVGRLAGRPVGVLTVGIGPRKATERMALGWAQWTADQVLNIGTCGALVDGLERGTLVTADRLYEETGQVAQIAPVGEHRRVGLTTVLEPVWVACRRDELARAGPEVVDMEAAAIWRSVPGVPFGVLKVVSDKAGGEVDPVIGQAGPDPARILRFKARALKLVESRLAPALVAWLQQNKTPAPVNLR